MSLYDVFHKAAGVAFNVFSSLMKDAEYISRLQGSGWGDDAPNPRFPMKVIVNGLTQEQVRNTKFFAQMNPRDTIIMVKGVDIIGNNITVSTSDKFSVNLGTVEVPIMREFYIIDHETDPASALFLILLRENYESAES